LHFYSAELCVFNLSEPLREINMPKILLRYMYYRCTVFTNFAADKIPKLFLPDFIIFNTFEPENKKTFTK